MALIRSSQISSLKANIESLTRSRSESKNRRASIETDLKAKERIYRMETVRLKEAHKREIQQRRESTAVKIERLESELSTRVSEEVEKVKDKHEKDLRAEEEKQAKLKEREKELLQFQKELQEKLEHVAGYGGDTSQIERELQEMKASHEQASADFTKAKKEASKARKQVEKERKLREDEKEKFEAEKKMHEQEVRAIQPCHKATTPE